MKKSKRWNGINDWVKVEVDEHTREKVNAFRIQIIRALAL